MKLTGICKALSFKHGEREPGIMTQLDLDHWHASHPHYSQLSTDCLIFQWILQMRRQSTSFDPDLGKSTPAWPGNEATWPGNEAT